MPRPPSRPCPPENFLLDGGVPGGNCRCLSLVEKFEYFFLGGVDGYLTRCECECDCMSEFAPLLPPMISGGGVECDPLAVDESDEVEFCAVWKLEWEFDVIEEFDGVFGCGNMPP